MTGTANFQASLSKVDPMYVYRLLEIDSNSEEHADLYL